MANQLQSESERYGLNLSKIDITPAPKTIAYDWGIGRQSVTERGELLASVDRPGHQQGPLIGNALFWTQRAQDLPERGIDPNASRQVLNLMQATLKL